MFAFCNWVIVSLVSYWNTVCNLDTVRCMLHGNTEDKESHMQDRHDACTHPQNRHEKNPEAWGSRWGHACPIRPVNGSADDRQHRSGQSTDQAASCVRCLQCVAWVMGPLLFVRFSRDLARAGREKKKPTANRQTLGLPVPLPNNCCTLLNNCLLTHMWRNGPQTTAHYDNRAPVLSCLPSGA